MVRLLSDAVSARDERRAAALRQELDLDGWQLAPHDSIFDNDVRLPPEWATEEYVLRLIKVAVASNRRLTEGAHVLNASSAGDLHMCVVCCDERVQVRIFKLCLEDLQAGVASPRCTHPAEQNGDGALEDGPVWTAESRKCGASAPRSFFAGGLESGVDDEDEEAKVGGCMSDGMAEEWRGQDDQENVVYPELLLGCEVSASPETISNSSSSSASSSLFSCASPFSSSPLYLRPPLHAT
jgi:hypothetical protein